MKKIKILIGLICLTGCTPHLIRKNDELADRYLIKNPESSTTIVVNQIPLHYISEGNTTKPKIIFIHGSPGSWKSFAKFLDDPELNSNAYLLLPDRPGYGLSNHSKPMASLAEQAQILNKLLDLGDSKQPAILVGHSYGGALVTRMAMQKDSRIKAIVIIAGSLDPALEQKKWFQYPADWFFVRLILPSELDSCNQEIEELKAELIAMEPLWPQIHAKVDVIQGLEDDLVPPGNADYIEKMLHGKNVSVTKIPDQGHFLPWEQYNLITSHLKKLLSNSRNR